MKRRALCGVVVAWATSPRWLRAQAAPRRARIAVVAAGA
jgi:hypothetical protein